MGGRGAPGEGELRPVNREERKASVAGFIIFISGWKLLKKKLVMKRMHAYCKTRIGYLKSHKEGNKNY